MKDIGNVTIATVGAAATTETSVRVLIGIATFSWMLFRALREYGKWKRERKQQNPDDPRQVKMNL